MPPTAEFVGRVPESYIWGVSTPFQLRNQLEQSLQEGCRKARPGVCVRPMLLYVHRNRTGREAKDGHLDFTQFLSSAR